MTQDGVAYLPEMQTQLVAARVVAEALADAAEEPEIQNGRITEIAGPRAERLADAAAALFASRGDSVEIRDGSEFGDPADVAAYAEGAALPATRAPSSPAPRSRIGSPALGRPRGARARRARSGRPFRRRVSPQPSPGRSR